MSDIYRGNGSRWGSITSDGKLYDTEGCYLGSINSSTGEIRDDQYRFIGRINYDGSINDAQGYHRGRVNEKGEFYDEHGDYLGSIWGFKGSIGAYHPGGGHSTGSGGSGSSGSSGSSGGFGGSGSSVGAGGSGGIFEVIGGGFLIFALYLLFKIVEFIFKIVIATIYLTVELCTSPFPVVLIALSALTVCINEMTASKSKDFNRLWLMNTGLYVVWFPLFWGLFDRRSVSVAFYLICGILFTWLMTWMTRLFYKIFGDARVQDRSFRQRLLLVLGVVFAVSIAATALLKYYGIGGVGQMNEEDFPYSFGTAGGHGGSPSGPTGDGYTGVEDEEKEPDIPEGAVSWGQHAYYIYNIKDEELDDYWEAEEFCEEQGGYLAVINSQEENDFLYDYICDEGLSVAFFGYSDDSEEGEWEWVYGSSDYENWADGQPNNGSANSNQRDENYAEFSKKAKDGTWNDAPFASNTYHFICEWESAADDERTDSENDYEETNDDEEEMDEDEEMSDEDMEGDEKKEGWTVVDHYDEYLKYFTELSSGELEYTSPAGDVRYVFPECHPDPEENLYLYYSLSPDGEREESASVFYEDMRLNIWIGISTLKNITIEEYFREKRDEFGREFDFSDVKDNECVYSYYLFEGETIDYIRAVIKNDTLYEIEYEYPTKNRSICDKLVEKYSGQTFLIGD